jgi:hypothetical protein
MEDRLLGGKIIVQKDFNVNENRFNQKNNRS